MIFPSLYEGFGLPVLEAMQLGTPVLTSTESSLPEVAGAAAMQVDPYDTAALAAAMQRIDGDTDLRRRLAGDGLVQAGRFTAEIYARRVQAMYETVLAAAPGNVLDPQRVTAP